MAVRSTDHGDSLTADFAAAIIDQASFERLMRPFAPFERMPALAVGVSGGADSMALALLADEWARPLGGRVIGLIVDHGLRDQSVDEARRAAEWLARHGIASHTLTWRREHGLTTAIQEQARDARRKLMLEWCNAHGIVHLLLAHHADDQLETLVMRRRRSAAGFGVAGISSLVETRQARILRPLLPVPRSRVRATLSRFRQGWIEDPSNSDERFERVRIRRRIADWSPGRRNEQLKAATTIARERRDMERRAAMTIAEIFSIHDEGYAWFDPGRLKDVSDAVASTAVGQVLRMVSGRGYPVGRDSLARAFKHLTDERRGGTTLGGCQMIRRRHGILICREPAAVEGPVEIKSGETVTWDGRFRVSAPERRAARRAWVAALGDDGWRSIHGEVGDGAAKIIPAMARKTLPAVYDDQGVLAVPHLTFERPGRHGVGGATTVAWLAPPEPATNAGFFVASVRE